MAQSGEAIPRNDISLFGGNAAAHRRQDYYGRLLGEFEAVVAQSQDIIAVVCDEERSGGLGRIVYYQQDPADGTQPSIKTLAVPDILAERAFGIHAAYLAGIAVAAATGPQIALPSLETLQLF